jgi:VWFA-related protein
LNAQSFKAFDVDASKFPTIKAKFYAFEPSDKQITNFSNSDFIITENGIPRKVINVSCPAPKPPVALSSVLVMDISGSMSSGPPRIESAKQAANAWVDGLPLGLSECALVSFSDNAFINQDFTTNRTKLKNSIAQFSPTSGTNYNQALIDPPCGALQVAATGKHKRVIVFLTDGLPNFEPNTQEIINFAIQNQITIYAVTLDMPAPQCIKEMTKKTGGEYFENITTTKEAAETYQKLLQLASNIEPCTIEWESGYQCNSGDISTIIENNGITSNLSYLSPNNFSINLEFSPKSIYFKNKIPGVKADTLINIKAVNADFNISKIISSDPNYSISPNSFNLKKGESINLTLSFTPPDSNSYFCTFIIENDNCPIKYYCRNYALLSNSKKGSLKLTHPNGGEEYIVGGSTLITWEGVLPTDTVRLEYSIDKGINWKSITMNGQNNKFIWENIPNSPSKDCLMRIAITKSPNVEWEFSNNYSSSIIETYTGEFISVGLQGSISTKESDLYIFKLDHLGKLIWKRVLGGSDNDIGFNNNLTYDNGAIISGFTDSNDGDIKKNNGDSDCWILKILNDGNLEWQNTYGGSGYDKAHCINQSYDGGYYFAGLSMSKNNDLNSNNGLTDCWIVKLDQQGKIIWQKSIGGSGVDNAYSIIELKEGGFVFVGESNSSNGDIKKNQGSSDFLVGKMNYNGNLEWVKTFGGSSEDVANSIIQTKKGNLIIGGYTNSINGDFKLAYGSSDITIFELDTSGNILWKKRYGGSSGDYLSSIVQTNDGGYIFSGTSFSKDGDVNNNTGLSKYLIIKIDSIGNVEWSKSLGKNYQDWGYSIKQTNDGGFIVSGSSGVIKLSPLETSNYQSDTSDAVWSIVAPQASSKDIDMKQVLVGSAKDSLVKAFISNVGSYKIRIDSIYFTGADASTFSLVSGFPKYEIAVADNKSCEFRFIPNRVGIHNATINIITQADTLRYSIQGEGVQPRLQILTKLLDFGKIEIGKENTFQDTALLKNLSGFDITVNDVVHLGPDTTQFDIISGGGKFTLTPGEERKLTVKFKPKYGGRTSGQLGFVYSGVGSPSVAQLFGQGIGGSVTISNDSAYAGENRILKLVMDKVKPEGIAAIAPNFEAKIRFQRTILATLNNNDWLISGDSIYLTIKGKIGTSLELAQIPVVAGLGNVESTNIDIIDIFLKDDFGNRVDYDFETQSGFFKLLGICNEGGTRLINPDGKAVLMSISPNPSDGNVTIDLNLIEKGNTSLKIYNSTGEIVYELKFEEFSGNKILNIETTYLSTGLYFVSLQTPTINKLEQLIIYK